MVPCSRSRTIAAPARMIASMVTLLMIPITLVNHAVVMFGLNADPHVEIDRRQRNAFRMGEEVGDLGRDDLLRIAGPEARLHHRGRIDVDLQPGPASAENVPLEVRRDVDDERVSSLVHQRNDVAFGDHLRRLEQRRQERMRDPARELGVVLVDDGDRGVVQFLRIAPRLHDHGQREGIDDQPQQHVVVQEAAQFLDAEPIDVRQPCASA